MCYIKYYYHQHRQQRQRKRWIPTTMAMIQNSENVREDDHRRRDKSNIQFHQLDNNNESNNNGVSNGVARNDVFNNFSNAHDGMTTRNNTEIPTTN
jgi:hypothetical protein